jgi:2-succinyl-5-enolpyruvyl-6-hydroxy-3-cyclohexene-1-carboxylate synthase
VPEHLVHIAPLPELCFRKGICTVVFSPGSRNAPLVQVFRDHGKIECLVVPDERAAGFFALGIAQQTRQPVAVCCTSGSAVVNYLPALTEAWYQQLPLVVFSADRPEQWIDQGDGQTIRQQGIFGTYVCAEMQLRRVKSADQQNANIQRLNEVLNAALTPPLAPVHINIPLEEPLYEVISALEAVEHFPAVAAFPISEHEIAAIQQGWKQARRKLIITGMLADGPELKDILLEVAADPTVVVLTETTSNLPGFPLCQSTDRIIGTIAPEEESDFQPDLVITIGHSIISKRIKALVRKWNTPHWHIGPEESAPDTFMTLQRSVRITPLAFFTLVRLQGHEEGSFYKTWKQRELITENLHQQFMESCSWSDLKACGLVLDYIPDFCNVQMGNSAVVRYIQLFPKVPTLLYHGNRGVSGIDGSVSTAAGAAWVNAKAGVNTLLLVGDMSFVYDSNGLWTNHLTPALRIVVINNNGGGIFRIIDGPSGSPYLEEFFEASTPVHLQQLCNAFHVNHYRCDSEETLHAVMPEFLYPQSNNRPALLEIVTPQKENAAVLKSYFHQIKTKCHEHTR